MKICLINSLYSPYFRGGAEVVVESIAQELQNLNHEVVIITLGRRNDLIKSDRLSVYRIKPFNVFSFLDINERPIWLRIFWHPLDVFNFSGYFQIKKILKSEKPDLVITHNLKGLGYLTPLAVKRSGIRHWHTLHDVQLSRPSGLIIFGQEKPFLIIDKVYEKICRFLFASPELIISPSQWLYKFYRTRGFFSQSKKIILPNPVNIKRVDHPAEPVTEKKKIELIYVGQIVSAKGIKFLIEACRKLPQKNWHLTIVGSGQAEEEVREMIVGNNNFTFVGRVDSSKMIDYYRQADLTVVPSLCYENSPTVIYESLVANVPVIASDIGGIPEIVKDGFNGYTFATGNEKNFIEVLEHFLSRPELIAELKKNCFVSVRNYSALNYVKELLKLL